MKRRFALLMILPVIAVLLTGCEKNRDDEVLPVTLGAQDNGTIPGFYSIGEDKTYTMSQAAASQDKIDLFCFYEADKDNNVCLASAGSGIKGIFEGDDSPSNWTTQRLTNFFLTTLTSSQFESVQEGDALIESSFNSEDSRKKAKDVQPGDVWAIKSDDGVYGLVHVTAVTQGAGGSVTFYLKTR